MYASPGQKAGVGLALIYGLGPLVWAPDPIVTGILNFGLKALWVLIFLGFITWGFIRGLHEHGEGLATWLHTAILTRLPVSDS